MTTLECIAIGAGSWIALSLATLALIIVMAKRSCYEEPELPKLEIIRGHE